MNPPSQQHSRSSGLSLPAGPALLFGLSTAAFLQGLGPGAGGALDRLLWGASAGGLLTAGLWIAWLGVRRSARWRVAMLLGIWIPYVNLLLASWYVRRHWDDDGRAPGWLAVAALLAQGVAGVRALLRVPPPLV